MPVTEIANAADLAAALKANKTKLVVVDFYATWCGPCKAIAPHVDQLSTRYAKEASFYKVDVDKAPDIAKDAGVTAMPSFGFYGDGKMVELMKGADPKGLEERVKKYGQQFFKSPFTSGSGYSLSGSSRPASAAAPAASAAAGSGGSAAAGGGVAPLRKNPWADPNFMPGKKGSAAAGAAGASATAAPAASAAASTSTAIPAGSKLLNSAAASSSSSSAPSAAAASPATPSTAAPSTSPAPSTADSTTATTAAAAAPPATASAHPALQVKPELLQQLRDMGFTELRAQKALLFTGNKDAEDALNWLVEHQEDADIDEPLQVVGVEKKESSGLPAGVNIDDLDEDGQVLYAEMMKRKAKEQAATAAASRSASSASVAAGGGGSGKKAVSDMTSEEKQQWLVDRKAEVKAKKESEAMEKVKSDFKSTKGMTSALNDLKDQREEFERQQAIARRKKEDADKAKQRREVQEKIAADKERRRVEQEKTMAALQKAKEEKANAGK